ncbi:MAG: D-2-hydroxyacid dehydrogenase [Candidatus Wildermuthbacteria bacterium]|nr:D-2-hydroxyacid dehydrogenase [Candidatus Wildermuthbacteria bacterium]
MNIIIISGEEKSHVVRTEHCGRIREAVPEADIRVFFMSQEKELRDALKNADILVASNRRMPSIAEAVKLAWIHSLSAGVDRLLTQEVKGSAVMVSNSSGVHAIPIAEHVIGSMLAFVKKFKEANEAQKNHAWSRRSDLTELCEKTVLIVGLGDIGKETARLAKAFGCAVLAVDRNSAEKKEYVDELRGPEDMDLLLPQADFLVIALPLTPATMHMFDAKKFSLMKKSAILVNIARGPIIKEDDLIFALQSGGIGGAALDVTQEEPLSPDSPLWDMQHVLITPHHSWVSEKYLDRAIDRFILNLKAFRNGETLPNLVDKEEGY